MATLQKQLLCTLKRPYKRSFLIQMALPKLKSLDIHVYLVTLSEMANGRTSVLDDERPGGSIRSHLN
jgi:hypothetical protein